MKSNISLFGLIVFNLVLLIQLASAQTNIIDFLTYDPFFRFILLFILFFAIVFFAVKNAFGEKNRNIAIIVAFVLSMFITLALVQRGYLFSYFGDDIGAWALIIAVIVAIGLLIKLAYANLGKWGAIVVLALAWFMLLALDPYDYIPLGSGGDTIIGIYDLLTGYWGFLGLILVCLIIGFRKDKKDKRRHYYEED